MIVGLALVVKQVDGLAADLERSLLPDGLIGIAEVVGKYRLLEPELPLVDDSVVAVHQLVAVESLHAGFVGDHAGGGGFMPAFMLELMKAEDMIDVAVRVDGCMNAIGRPAPHRLVQLIGVERTRCVEEYQPFLGRHDADIRERAHEREAAVQLLESDLRRSRVNLGAFEFSSPGPLGKFDNLAHGDGY